MNRRWLLKQIWVGLKANMQRKRHSHPRLSAKQIQMPLMWGLAMKTYVSKTPAFLHWDLWSHQVKTKQWLFLDNKLIEMAWKNFPRCDQFITDKEHGVISSLSGNFRELSLKLKCLWKRKGIKNSCDHKTLVTQLTSVQNKQS